MNRKHFQRFVAFALLALGSVACTATVGVGVGVPIYGGWGGHHGGWGHPYGGVCMGGPIYP
jgi:hypothetical protein